MADWVSPAVGALMEPLEISYMGVNYHGDISGKSVFIVGTGTIGLLVIACVKMKCASRIFVSDIDNGRLEVAKHIGADVAITPLKRDLRPAVFEVSGGIGVDAGIETVGISATVQQVMSVLPL